VEKSVQHFVSRYSRCRGHQDARGTDPGGRCLRLFSGEGRRVIQNRGTKQTLEPGRRSHHPFQRPMIASTAYLTRASTEIRTIRAYSSRLFRCPIAYRIIGPGFQTRGSSSTVTFCGLRRPGKVIQGRADIELHYRIVHAQNYTR
jgi:hypothetical protein